MAPGALDQYRIPEDNMRFFTNGTDLSLPHAVVDWRYIGKKDHGLDVLYVGHVLRVRGLETVVDAARLAKDRGVSLRWTLIGPSNAQERRWLEKKISGLPVEYLGVLPHARSLQYIASADVCLCPFPRMMGTEFIYPIKVFEYMAFGKVVVATDLPGTRRIIENEKNGFLVPPENPEALVTTLSRLAMDADLRNRIGREAFISVRQYNWVRIHADFIKALEEALG
ncbi:glycosyltransferase [Candidatus Parcubacteria bacterium]|nr:MAG: glycosyltransferase [Candidatus Parcubacteria bacterium]